jgi:CheY-like chemotaxis protein
MGTVELLLLDDDANNARQIKEILQSIMIQTNLSVVSNPEEAQKYLRREGGFSEARSVDLILLNFELLARDRSRMLRNIGNGSGSSQTPVMILDLPAEPRDVLKFRLYLSILHSMRSRFSESAAVPEQRESRPVAAYRPALATA